MDKEKLVKLQLEIRDAMKLISEKLVQMSQLRGGDGYEFECKITVVAGEVRGTMGGKAFKLVEGGVEYLPDMNEDNKSSDDNAATETADGLSAAAAVRELFARLGIKEAK